MIASAVVRSVCRRRRRRRWLRIVLGCTACKEQSADAVEILDVADGRPDEIKVGATLAVLRAESDRELVANLRSETVGNGRVGIAPLAKEWCVIGGCVRVRHGTGG